MTKNNKRLIIFFILLLFLFIPILFGLKIPCLFKSIFSIPCPGCGLTRSIFSLLNLDIKLSLYYNILGIPIFFIMLTSYIIIIHDIIKKENYLTSFWFYLIRHYIIIIILLIVSFIINNIHDI